MTSDDFHDGKTESLPEWLRARARDTSDGRLIAAGAAAIVVIGAMTFWHPARIWMPILSAAVGVIAFVTWAITDRELAERGAEAGAASMSLRVARAVAGAAGWIALLALMVGVLGVGLGTWIS